MSLNTKRDGKRWVGSKIRFQKQIFICLNCHKHFSFKTPTKILSYKIFKDSLEGRSSMRTIGRRKHLSKNTVSKVITSAAKEARGSIWMAKNLKPNWGHILGVDGKLIRVFNPGARDYVGTRAEKQYQLKKSWIVGVDVLTKDLPHYQVFDGEGKIDLYDFFKTLKDHIGYDLKVLVCDGVPETTTAVRMVYGNVGIQLCVRHFIEMLKLYLRAEKKEDRAQTEHLILNIWSALGVRRENDCFDTLRIFTKDPKTRCQKLIVKSLERHIYQLTTHFRFSEQYFVPRYNNDIENLFKQVSLRLKSWNMFRNKQSADNYLKAWALHRRFTKFTDCRGHINRLKNGKAPLELAGVDIAGIDYLKF